VIETFVRPSVSADAPAVAELEFEARTALQGQRGADRLLDAHPLVGSQWVERIEGPDWLVLVGGIDTVVLAYLVARVAGDDGVAFIEQVFVTEGARELGLGDGLVELALEELAARGAIAVDALALPGDRQTKNLFERNGLTARLITVTRRLD
jgi:GNAT superfamily N-acetyltransferase